jgi:tetratricopeptide (TPR) repeat protein
MHPPVPILLFALFTGVSAVHVSAEPQPGDAPLRALWASVDHRFAMAEDNAVRAALPASFSTDDLLLTPATLPQPTAEAWSAFPPRLAEWLQRAWLRLGERDYPEAIHDLERIINTAPRTTIGATATYLRAAAEVAFYRVRDARRPQDAIESLAQAVTLHPAEPPATRALFTLAELYRTHDRWDEALAYYHRAGGVDGDPELRPYVRYREMTVRERRGEWLEAYRVAKEILTAFPDHPVAALARMVYLDNAVATGDAPGILREYQTLVAAGAVDLAAFPTYRYEVVRALLARGETAQTDPLLDRLREELTEEAPASLLMQEGDAALRAGRPAEALATYEKVQVQYGRTAMAELSRLRKIQVLYPETGRLDRLPLLAPLRNLAIQTGRPQLRALARDLHLGLWANEDRWDDVIERLDNRPRTEQTLPSEPWFEPFYGYAFSRLWLDRLPPRDLLEVYYTFRAQRHDTATLTPGFRRHLAGALTAEGYMEGAVVLLAHLAATPGADADTRLAYLEALAAAYSPELEREWRDFIARVDVAALPPRERLRCGALGLRLGDREASLGWSASAVAEDPTLSATLPEASYHLAVAWQEAGRLADAAALLEKIEPASVASAVTPWRVAASLAQCLHGLGNGERAAAVLHRSLTASPPTSLDERAWADHFLALIEGHPAGGDPAELPPFWQGYQTVQDRFLQWQVDNQGPLQRLRTAMQFAGIWQEFD